jgi:hypothetical protein
MAPNGPAPTSFACPLSGDQRTNPRRAPRSQFDPLRTWEATLAITLKVFLAIKRGHLSAGARERESLGGKASGGEPKSPAAKTP